MSTKLDTFNKTQIKKQAPDIRPGDIVRVKIKLPEKTKRGAQKFQIFEGLIIARKHGKGLNATFTVRKIFEGVGVERIFPIHCPSIIKIEIVKRSKVRRAKLYYMRQRTGKKARMSARGGSPPKADAPREHASGGKTKELSGMEWTAPEEKKIEEKPKKEEK